MIMPKHEQLMSPSFNLARQAAIFLLQNTILRMLSSKDSMKSTLKWFMHLVRLSWSRASESKPAYSRSSRLSQAGWIDWSDLNIVSRSELVQTPYFTHMMKLIRWIWFGSAEVRRMNWALKLGYRRMLEGANAAWFGTNQEHICHSTVRKLLQTQWP